MENEKQKRVGTMETMGSRLPFRCCLFFLLGCLVLALFSIPLAIQGRDPEKADWTILIYGHGDHDLAVGLVEDLLEMEKVGSSDRFHIIIQTDFDSTQEEDLLEAGLPLPWLRGSQRIRITRSSEDAETLESKVVETLPEQNMDDPEVLERFLSWGLQKYPSRRVGIILTDHGDQWYGFGGDTQDGELEETGEISLSDLGKTLQKVLKGHREGSPVEFIALDCCLMGSAEVISELHPFCQILIASAEIDYGYGLDYEATLKWLKDHPNGPMEEFAKAEVESWKAHQFRKEEPAPGLLGSHACYDCRKGPELESAMEAFTKALLEQAPSNPRFLPSTRRLCTEYGLEPATLGQPTDYADLGEFASKVAEANSVPSRIREKAIALRSVIDKLVLFHGKGELRATATGISIWYPTSGRPKEIPVEEPSEKKSRRSLEPEPGSPDAIFARYQLTGFARKTGWDKWLNRVHRDAGKVREIALVLPRKIAENGLKIVQGKSAAIPFSLGRARTAWKADLFLYSPPTSEGEDDWTELGWVSKVSVEGNGRYQLKVPAMIPTIVSADGKKRLPLGAESVNSDGSLLASKCLYFPPKPRGNQEGELVSILWTCKGDKIQPLVAIKADDEGGSIAEASLKPGGKITLMRNIEIRRGDNPDDWEVQLRRTEDSFEIPKGGLPGLKAEFGFIPVGDHELLLVVDDVYGITGTAETIPFKVVAPR